jgi:putative ABC transport system permease protein
MLRHYLTISLRDILRQPLSTAIGVLTLSIGLVCVMTAYAIVRYWQHSDGQFAKTDRTYIITAALAIPEQNLSTGTWSYTNEFYARYIETEYPELEAVARSVVASDVSISTNDRGIRATRMLVDPAFSRIFDLPFLAGDPQTALSRPLSVVLTEETARSLFGDEDPIGKGVNLANQVDVTVTGVIEAIAEPSHMQEIDFFGTWDIWDQIRLARARANDPDLEQLPEPQENWFANYCCATYALLPEDGSLTGERLDEQLADFASRRLSAEELSRFSLEVGAVPLAAHGVTTLDSNLFGPASDFLSITTILFVLGALILAIACVNYANLATARAFRRARDVALRKVVGASRLQVAFQYFFESGVLVSAALCISVLGMLLLVPALRASIEIDLASVATLSAMDFYLFVLVLLVLVTFVSGAYPAIVLSGIRPVEALRLGRLRSGPKRMSTILVGTQFLAASFLLIVVIVMYAQNLELRSNGLGAISEPIVLIDNAIGLTGVSEETLQMELARLPQVRGVTSAGNPPWGGGVNINLVSRSPESTTMGQSVFSNVVGYDFFEVFDIPVVAGRVFDREHGEDMMPPSGERDPDRPLSAVLDRDFARELGFESPQATIDQIVYWPEGSGPGATSAQQLRIIGVVENRPLHFSGFGVSANYFLLSKDFEIQLVRLDRNDVAGALEAIDAMWSRLSPSMPRSRRFLDEVFEETYETFGRMNQLFTTLALMAFFISLVGLLGMAIQVASRRRHEMGVRKTLGASARDIVRLMLKDFSRPVVIANLIAWPLAFLAANVYLSLFMHRIPLGPLPFVLSLILTLLVAWVTVGGQALKSSRVRPAEVLNYE